MRRVSELDDHLRRFVECRLDLNYHCLDHLRGLTRSAGHLASGRDRLAGAPYAASPWWRHPRCSRVIRAAWTRRRRRQVEWTRIAEHARKRYRILCIPIVDLQRDCYYSSLVSAARQPVLVTGRVCCVIGLQVNEHPPGKGASGRDISEWESPARR
jgi:hypothetical protein